MTGATIPVPDAAAPPRAARGALGHGPVVLAATGRSRGDGVGYVALLLERALADLQGAPRVVELGRSGSDRVSPLERARFVAALTAAGARARGGWVLYNHVGIARAQRWLPGAARRPYAVFVHGIEVWDQTLDAPRRRVLREATLRLANSEYTARRTMERYPEIGPVVATPLALLPDDGAPEGVVDEQLIDGIDRSWALIVGRMSAAERYKGHDELLECWSGVRARTPGARLAIVGGGDDAERLRGKAAALGLADAVRFCGRVSDATLAVLYERAGVFTMPSRGEGFGLVYLQAMRAGLPCVAALDDAAGEVVADGETGLLVRQRDRGALIDAIARILGHGATRMRMGVAARARVAAHFTYESFRDRLAAAIAGAGSGDTN